MSTYTLQIEGPNPDGFYEGCVFVDGEFVRAICHTTREEVIVDAQRWADYARKREATRETVTL